MSTEMLGKQDNGDDGEASGTSRHCVVYLKLVLFHPLSRAGQWIKEKRTPTRLLILWCDLGWGRDEQGVLAGWLADLERG